jgi:hypothetical protein
MGAITQCFALCLLDLSNLRMGRGKMYEAAPKYLSILRIHGMTLRAVCPKTAVKNYHANNLASGPEELIGASNNIQCENIAESKPGTRRKQDAGSAQIDGLTSKWIARFACNMNTQANQSAKAST